MATNRSAPLRVLMEFAKDRAVTPVPTIRHGEEGHCCGGKASASRLLLAPLIVMLFLLERKLTLHSGKQKADAKNLDN
jgi:hypothetical protein